MLLLDIIEGAATVVAGAVGAVLAGALLGVVKTVRERQRNVAMRSQSFLTSFRHVLS